MASDNEPNQNAPAALSGRIVIPKAEERQFWDAPEPGFYRDPETGTLHRTRRNRRLTRKKPQVRPYRVLGDGICE